MRPTNFLFLLISFTFLCSVLSVKEWKKFENGKVRIHKKLDKKYSKNIATGGTKTEEQHFLHGHHSARLKNRQQGKPSGPKPFTEKTGYAKITKDRHHKLENEKARRLSSGIHDTILNQANLLKEHPQLFKVRDKSVDDEKQLKAFKIKSNKTNQLEKFQFNKAGESILKSNNYKSLGKHTKQESGKKKLGMSKMDGNSTAKKLWKQIVRDQVKSSERLKIPKGNISPTAIIED